MCTSSTYLIFPCNCAVTCFLLALFLFFSPVLCVWEELFSILQPEQTHEGSLWGAPLQMCLLQQGKAKPCPIPPSAVISFKKMLCV